MVRLCSQSFRNIMNLQKLLRNNDATRRYLHRGTHKLNRGNLPVAKPNVDANLTAPAHLHPLDESVFVSPLLARRRGQVRCQPACRAPRRGVLKRPYDQPRANDLFTQDLVVYATNKEVDYHYG